MLKRYEMQDCPVDVTLTIIDRYNLLIVHHLLKGTKRFGELKKAISGVSQKVLTEHLKIMEENKLIIREAFFETTPRVEYSLTELGKTLHIILDAMWEWGEIYKEESGKN
ncbi:MAG: helix-turn-helix transcriptional regulator [Firmicutes bacterium]|nr:helix-turn-helix transcriptional regulator [Bacillota bacterium]